jgi:hypothetical protein
MTIQLVTDGVLPSLRFQGIPPANTPNNTTFAFKITATDTTGATAVTNLSLLVKQNLAATLVGSLPAQTLRVYDNFQLQGALTGLFNDPEGDLLNYSLSFTANDPTAQWLNLSINRITGQYTLYGTPTSNTQAGARSVQLIATDISGLTTALTINFTVQTDTPPAVLNVVPNQTVLKSRNFSYVFPANTFTDADGDTLAYSAVQLLFIPAHTDGEGAFVPDAYIESALPSWMSLDSATRTLRGAAPASVQTIQVILYATDTRGRTISTSFTVTNSGVATNTAPTYLAGSLPARSASEGVAVDFVLPGNAFSDANADKLTYTAQIQIGTTWTNLPVLGLSIDQFTGRITGTPAAPAATSYSMRIIASDGAASVTSASFTLSMNRIPTLSSAFSNRTDNVNTAFSSWSFTATRFTDPNGTALTYSATGLPPGVSFNASTRTFSGTPTALGNYNVTIAASDGVLSKLATFTWQVDSPGTDYAPIVANALVDQNTVVNTAWSYTVPSNTFTDANSNPLTYTATLADGSALPSWLSFNATTRTFSGTPTTLGPVALKVIATDGLFMTPALMTVSVALAGNVGPTAVASIPDQVFHKTQGWNFRVPYRTFVDSNQGDALSLTATFADGTALPSWLVFDTNEGTFYVKRNATLDFPPLSTYKWDMSIKITARDASSAAASQTFVLTAVKDDSSSLPTNYVDPFVAANVQKNYWYTYDAENRLLVNHGQLINAGTGTAQIVLGQDDVSSGQSYDANGRVVSRQVGVGGNINVEVSTYSDRGLLLNVYQPVVLGQAQTTTTLKERRTYDANDRLLSTSTYFRLAETRENTTAGQYTNIGGWLKHQDTYSYNRDSQVIFQASFGRVAQWKASVTPNLALETGSTSSSPLSLLSSVSSTYLNTYRWVPVPMRLHWPNPRIARRQVRLVLCRTAEEILGCMRACLRPGGVAVRSLEKQDLQRIRLPEATIFLH